MILIVLLLAVLVVGAVAGLLGIGVLSDDRRRNRSGLAAMASAPVVLAIGVALCVMAALVVGGLPSGSGHAPGTESRGASGGRTEVTQPLPSTPIYPDTATIPVIAIEPAAEDRFSVYRPVSGLTPDSVVRVQAKGFEWFERGRVEQCVMELGRQTACSPPFPVQFDDDGEADFQFGVSGNFAPGGCRAGQPTCLLHLSGDQSGRQGSVQTVLIDRLIPGAVHVESGRESANGQTVEVSVTGFPAGARATAVLCAPPEAYDARRCTSPGPTSTFAVDAGGSGHTSLVASTGRLGSDAAGCGPRRPCGVAVVVGPGFVVAPVAPVMFSLGPGVAYHSGRLILGVGGALALLAAAIVITRQTDWTKPTEAATPSLDGADLRAGMDLDELFGSDEELERRDPILW